MHTCASLVKVGALVGGLLVLGPVQAPRPLVPPVTVRLFQTAASFDVAEYSPHPPSLIATRALLGVPVTTADGDPLGQLDDVLIDPMEGWPTMAIVAAGGRFGLGGRFMALPWPMLRPAPDGTALVLALGPLPPQYLPHQQPPADVPPY
jgi:PRC-barrel domain